MADGETRDALAALLRWQESGGMWRVRPPAGRAAVVDLVTCDGGEVVGRLASSDPGFVAHVNSDPGRPTGEARPTP